MKLCYLRQFIDLAFKIHLSDRRLSQKRQADDIFGELSDDEDDATAKENNHQLDMPDMSEFCIIITNL